MRYHDFYDPRPANQERPRDIASLFVHKPEWADMQAICAAHGSARIVDIRKVPIIPAFVVEVLCPDARTALALMAAWLDRSEASPHRPRTEEEREAWGRSLQPELASIPKDWTF